MLCMLSIIICNEKMHRNLDMKSLKHKNSWNLKNKWDPQINQMSQNTLFLSVISIQLLLLIDLGFSLCVIIHLTLIQ